jgi:peptidoglycan biosynthesis protein MviN/MurJ (putative lipid II flippase)
MARTRKQGAGYFISSFGVVLGVVLVWRGVWYALDWLDTTYLGGTHWITVVGSIVLGFAILYLPDRNLSELRKL